MRAMLASCLMAAFFVSTASAQEAPKQKCTPVGELKQTLLDNGFAPNLVKAIYGEAFTLKYLGFLGGPPPNSKPVGILFAAAGNGVAVFVIEEAGCNTYRKIIPAAVHVKIMDTMMKGA